MADLHPLTPDELRLLTGPLSALGPQPEGTIRELLDCAFIGTPESGGLFDDTVQWVSDTAYLGFHSELPSLAIDRLVRVQGVSPIAATGAQLRTVLYETFPQERWFSGYCRDDLLSFIAYWAWLVRIFDRDSLRACLEVCKAALVDFDAEHPALPHADPEDDDW